MALQSLASQIIDFNGRIPSDMRTALTAIREARGTVDLGAKPTGGPQQLRFGVGAAEPNVRSDDKRVEVPGGVGNGDPAPISRTWFSDGRGSRVRGVQRNLKSAASTAAIACVQGTPKNYRKARAESLFKITIFDNSTRTTGIIRRMASLSSRRK